MPLRIENPMERNDYHPEIWKRPVPKPDQREQIRINDQMGEGPWGPEPEKDRVQIDPHTQIVNFNLQLLACSNL